MQPVFCANFVALHSARFCLLSSLLCLPPPCMCSTMPLAAIHFYSREPQGERCDAPQGHPRGTAARHENVRVVSQPAGRHAQGGPASRIPCHLVTFSPFHLCVRPCCLFCCLVPARLGPPFFQIAFSYSPTSQLILVLLNPARHIYRRRGPCWRPLGPSAHRLLCLFFFLSPCPMVPTLQQLAVSMLIKWRKSSGDIGLEDILAACSPPELADIEDGTRRGSGRMLRLGLGLSVRVPARRSWRGRGRRASRGCMRRGSRRRQSGRRCTRWWWTRCPLHNRRQQRGAPPLPGRHSQYVKAEWSARDWLLKKLCLGDGSSRQQPLV